MFRVGTARYQAIILESQTPVLLLTVNCPPKYTALLLLEFFELRYITKTAFFITGEFNLHIDLPLDCKAKDFIDSCSLFTGI
ncbi:hypothetical protein F2P81_020108 [Scophthalmus maximus]|uniref:Endonuclease/exonuclease/phosphatase domain-containing protein n=1 Tax=Scophthalmus maximus TaxID=52904 RepID=A0A6A4S2X8_SCOMX|nr:hypothetical protein F2P81_020108 [Scophthalmus maximus]